LGLRHEPRRADGAGALLRPGSAFTYGRKSVFSHFGHGGSVSESAFSTKAYPQLVQVYVPFPGFSPVVDLAASLNV
jgi:hypothetical protein